MYIRLKWTNANTQSVVTNIYRGTTTLDRNNLGTPLVTLSNGETEYYDRTVVGGTTYYYVIECVSATGRAKSRVYSFLADYVRGHGGNVVMFGDDDYGFMGIATFNSYTELLTKIGVGRESTTPSTDNTTSAAKFTINGKVYAIVNLNGAYVDFTTALAFLKRTDKLAITVDSVKYLAYPLDMTGDTFVFNGTYVAQAPTGRRDMFEQLVISQVPGIIIDGSWKADVIGRIHNAGNTTSWSSKATADMARIPIWVPTSNMIGYATTLTASQTFAFVLELVEG